MSKTFSVIQQNKPEYTPLDDKEPLLTHYKMGNIITGSAIYVDPVAFLGCFKSKVFLNTDRIVWGAIPKLDDVSTGFTGGYSTPILISEAKNNDKKYIEHYDDFLQKWKVCNSEFESFEEILVFEKFKVIINKLLAFNPQYITFSITDEQSIYFQSSIEDHNIYFELYFDRAFPDGTHSVINIFKNKKPLIAFEGSINECISEISNQIIPKDLFFIWQECGHEISHQTNTSTEL